MTVDVKGRKATPIKSPLPRFFTLSNLIGKFKVKILFIKTNLLKSAMSLVLVSNNVHFKTYLKPTKQYE